MANTQETIADIIAAMRDEGRTGGSSCLEWVGTKMRYYADRLEAAWNREKAEIEADALAAGGLVEASRATAEKSSAVGDCAKLREALKTVKRYLDGYTVNILEMRRQVDATLAAPPRNCDRFKDALDAWDAYDAFVDSYRAQGKTEPLNEFGWLYAPATEEEGCAK